MNGSDFASGKQAIRKINKRLVRGRVFSRLRMAPKVGG
jgi:hypothetical protein